MGNILKFTHWTDLAALFSLCINLGRNQLLTLPDLSIYQQNQFLRWNVLIQSVVFFEENELPNLLAIVEDTSCLLKLMVRWSFEMVSNLTLSVTAKMLL